MNLQNHVYISVFVRFISKRIKNVEPISKNLSNLETKIKTRRARKIVRFLQRAFAFSFDVYVRKPKRRRDLIFKNTRMTKM